MVYRKILSIAFLFVAICNSLSAQVQEPGTPDSLLLAARRAAFVEKDYGLARIYLYKALSKSPGYADVRIFLGRIYTWGHDYDSAKTCFAIVLAAEPGNEDAAMAYTDLEYWNDHPASALLVCEKGLAFHPASEELLLRKAKIFLVMKKFSAADSVLRQIIRQNPHQSAARAMQNGMIELSSRNKIGMSYDFVYFDRQFDAPWHLLSLDWGKTTGLGAVTARINYANRFREGAVQYELDAYPHISKMFYSYMELAYSDNESVFPHWHAGFSLYGNLPAAFEGELGFRYLQFSSAPTWIYTAYLGKYYKNWLFGARAYLTPSTYSTAPSLSYTISARYYFGGADDLVGLSGGYGLSPDDRSNVTQLNSATRLVSGNLGLLFRKKIGHRYVLSASAGWINQEYLPGTKGNQYDAGLGWQYRF